MGGGKSQSSSSNVTTTSTFDIKDAYNTTYNDVRNLSDVGNVSVLGGGSTSTLAATLPLALVAIAAFALLLKKKG